MLLECEALLKMCSTRKFLKIFDYFLFLDLLANIDVFCRKTSEIFYPFSHFHASWRMFFLYVFCKIN